MREKMIKCESWTENTKAAIASADSLAIQAVTTLGTPWPFSRQTSMLCVAKTAEELRMLLTLAETVEHHATVQYTRLYGQ